MANDLTYAIVDIATDLPNVDFSQICEADIDTVRKSVNENEFVIKWNNEPTFITDGTVTPIGGTMTHSECLVLLGTPEWSDPNPPI